MIDHRRLGRELELFDSDPLAAPGCRSGCRPAPPPGTPSRSTSASWNAGPATGTSYSPPLGKREMFELSGHLAQLRRRHVPADAAERRRRVRAAAQPLPAPRAGVPGPRPLLPGAAAADRRAGRHVPGRTLRRARRAVPGPGHLAQRRAQLLRPGAGRRRGRRDPAADPRGARRARRTAGRVPAVAARAGASKYVGDDAEWARAEELLRAALDGVDVHRGARRGRVLRPEDRHPDRRRGRAGVHPLHRPARLRQAGAVRPVVHRLRTARGGGR